MRSDAGTKSGETSFVVLATKSRMDCFAGPSFHEGSGSWALTVVMPAMARARRALQVRIIFIGMYRPNGFVDIFESLSVHFGSHSLNWSTAPLRAPPADEWST